jgi:hypothetical protein
MDEAIIDLSSPHTARADSPFVDSPIQRCLSDPGRWRNVSQLSDMSDDASSEHIRNDGTQIVLCSTLSLGSLRCLPRLRGDIKKMLYLYWKMVVAGTEAPASDGPDDEAAGGCAPAGTKRNPRRIFQQVFDRDSLTPQLIDGPCEICSDAGVILAIGIASQLETSLSKT